MPGTRPTARESYPLLAALEGDNPVGVQIRLALNEIDLRRKAAADDDAMWDAACGIDDV